MKKISILFALLVFTSGFAMANMGFSSANLGGMDAGAINQRYTRDLRTHEIQTRAKSRSAIVTTKTQPKTQEEVTAADIKFVVFVNNHSIPSSELSTAIAKRLNKPMSPENISAIRRDVMRYYQAKGYFSAVAMVTAQDTQNGSITIEVKEGGKNSIIIQE
ncbi:MAG: hypothetical protein IJY61_07575 [Candidatus Gastranaerophilales bacterium]|nr:hypothetical protein [Candidatus Gastranaerophilales bacterium]